MHASPQTRPLSSPLLSLRGASAVRTRTDPGPPPAQVPRQIRIATATEVGKMTELLADAWGYLDTWASISDDVLQARLAARLG